MPDHIQKPVRTALVGCGKVGHTHAQALKTLPQSEFSAVCDQDAQRAADFATQYGVQPYTNFEAMLEETHAGMVSVCTPHPVHAESIVAAAGKGVHVLTEKPLAPDLQGCDRSIQACRQNSVRLGVISQRRFYQPVVRMRQAIDLR